MAQINTRHITLARLGRLAAMTAGVTAGTLAASAGAATVELNKVALSGETLPGLSTYQISEFFISPFTGPSIAPDGTVSSEGKFNGPTPPFPLPPFVGVGKAGSFRSYVSTLDVAPGTSPAANFFMVGALGFSRSDNGHIGLFGRINGAPAATRFAYYRAEPDGSLAQVLRAGDPAPTFTDGTVISGEPAAFALNGTQIRINDAGTMVFASRLTGEDFPNSSDRVIYAGTPGNWQLLAREGYPIGESGYTAAGSDNEFDSFEAGINLTNSGIITFVASTNGGSVLFKGPLGNIQPYLTITTQAPGFADGITIGAFNAELFRLNQSGHIAILCPTTQPTSDEFYNINGIFADFGSGLQRVAAWEDPAPGLSNMQFGSFYDDNSQGSQFFAWSDDLRISFIANLLTPYTHEDKAVYVSDNTGALTLLMRENDAAFGYDAGYKYGEPLGSVLNGTGMTVFFTNILDSSSAAAGQAIYARDAAGVTSVVVKTGDQVEVAPGDVRTISQLEIARSHRVGRALNDAGELVMWVRFTDNSQGLFTADLAPEPACAADFNGDDTRDVADLFAYINAWLAKTPNADFNDDSTVDVADLFAYINAWLAGC